MAEAYYALIKGSEVKNVVVFDEPTEDLLNIFKQEWDCDQVIETNFNPRAMAGGTWDGENFIAVKPFNSWILNETFDWVAPTPYPDHIEGYHVWNEETTSWVLVEEDAE